MFVPSPEQQAIFDYVNSQKDKPGRKALAVAALAGTGKTSSILELIRRIPDCSGIYCAFNKSIAEEVKPRLAGTKVEAKTFHSMGYGVLLNHLKKEYQVTRFKTNEKKYEEIITELVRENASGLNLPDAVMRGFERFLRDLTRFARLKLVEWDDIPALRQLVVRVLDDEALLEYVESKGEQIITDGIHMVKAIMERAEAQTKMGIIDFTDMIYWNVRWNLALPTYRWVFVDESQDLSPMQREMVYRSTAENSYSIIIGDQHQCVIDGTLIDGTPVETIQKWDMTSTGFGRGTIKKSIVTDVFHRYVEDKPVVTIETRTGRSLTTTREHTHFAGYLDREGTFEPYFVYLMYKSSHGYRVGITRKYRPSNKQTLGYKVRASQEVADNLWLLKACQTEQEAHYWEDYFAAQYGLPTVTFKYVESTPKSAGLALSQTLIDKLYRSIDTEPRAKRLLNDMGIAYEHPHYAPKCMTKARRRNVTITMCSDPRGDKPLHEIEMSGSDDGDAQLLTSIGFKVTDNGKGTGWRLRRYSQNLGELYDALARVQSVMDVNVIQLAALAEGRSLPLTPAGNILPGMMVFITKNGRVELDEVVAVKHHFYTGYVHDLNINRVHNYDANGILTHNSIYAFAGADADSWDLTVKKFEAKTLPLTVTRRCATIITQHAQSIVPSFRALPDAPRGKIVWWPETSLANVVEPGDLVVCRLKAPVVKACLQLLPAGIPATILGSDIGKALIGILEKIEKRPGFTFMRIVDHLDAYVFAESVKWQKKGNERRAEAIQDECAALATIIEEMRPKPLSVRDVSDFIATLFVDAEKDNIVTFATAHKSKGLEADTVYILAPERMPLRYRDMTDEEMLQEDNLHYVAITRAKRTLVFLTNKKFLEKMADLGGKPPYIQTDFSEQDWGAKHAIVAPEVIPELPVNKDEDGVEIVEAPAAETPEPDAQELALSPIGEKPLVITPVVVSNEALKRLKDNPLVLDDEDVQPEQTERFVASGNLQKDMQRLHDDATARLFKTLNRLTLQQAITLRELLDTVIDDLQAAV